MEIRQLRYFLDIAATEHLTTSAHNLYVTQSTLSHGLRQLEDELGVVLFDRLGRGLKLSQAGAVFQGYAARALREIEAGRMALSDISGLQAGTLTVGVIPTFLTTLVPAAVTAFASAWPRVRLTVRDLRAGPIEDLLAAGALDLGIAFTPAGRSDIDTETLFEESLQLVVGSGHALARRRTLRLKALADVPLALLTRDFATRRLIDASLRTAGITPPVPVEMESVEALIAACRHDSAGCLACIVPERAARAALTQGPGLRVIDLIEPRTVRQAGILWRHGASRSRAALEFAALLPRVP